VEDDNIFRHGRSPYKSIPKDMEFSKLYYDIYDDYSDEESDNDEGEETNEGMGG